MGPKLQGPMILTPLLLTSKFPKSFFFGLTGFYLLKQPKK
jgi:hypothetical protein